MKKIILLIMVSLSLFLRVQAQVEKTVTITAGGLSAALTQNEILTVTKLNVNGTINLSDFTTMRTMWVLNDLNLKGVTKVEASGTNAENVLSGVFFEFNTVLIKVVLPDCVTAISEQFFQNCSNLAEVTLPASLQKMGTSIFTGCVALTTVNQFPVLSKIPDLTFQNCFKLTSFVVPEGVDTLGVGVFMSSGLTSITLPSTLTTIGGVSAGSFQYCASLTGVNIPSGVTYIGNNTFNGCSALRTIQLPAGLQELGGVGTFSYTGLVTWAIPAGTKMINNEIGNAMFQGCGNLTSVNIPSSVTRIGISAFTDCLALQSIALPNNLTEIGSNAFVDCSALQSIALPNSLTEIGDYAFYSSSLTSIEIPDNVTVIGEGVFWGCTGLQSIKVHNSFPVNFSAMTDVFTDVDKTACTLYVPQGSKADYQEADLWKDFVNIVEFSVKQAQTISGLSDITKTYADADFDLTATASSGLGVTYAFTDPTIATITNNRTVHILKAGTTTLTASQAGDDNFSAADGITVNFTVNKATQTISGLANMDKKVNDANFDLSAIATSGLAVEYSSSNTTVATILGNTVHIVGAGTTSIIASQGGNDNYLPATDVQVNLTVTSPSGLWDVRNNTSLSITVNPVAGSEARLTFTEAGQGAVLRITDLTGKTLVQQNLAEGVTTAAIPLDKLSKGVYLVNYTDNNGKRATVKMIK